MWATEGSGSPPAVATIYVTPSPRETATLRRPLHAHLMCDNYWLPLFLAQEDHIDLLPTAVFAQLPKTSTTGTNLHTSRALRHNAADLSSRFNDIVVIRLPNRTVVRAMRALSAVPVKSKTALRFCWVIRLAKNGTTV